jgi:GlpG protein
MIGTIPRAEDAERFSDYLVTRDIDNMVEESSSGDWTVWIEHDDHIDAGKSELQAFLTNPADPKYNSAAHAENIRKEEEKKRERRRRQFIDVRTTWGQPQQWAVPITLFLIVASVVVSVGTRFGTKMQPVGDWLRIESVAEQERVLEEILQEHGLQPGSALIGGKVWNKNLPEVRRGQVWRLITPIFIHLSVLHLFFNMFWLLDLGAMIERRRGTWIMLGLVLSSAILSNLTEYFWAGPSFGGMSGVVYALFGYVWIKGKFQPHLQVGVSQQTVTIMLAWLALCMTGLIGDIANAAHLAGLLVGMATAYLPHQYNRLRRMRR